MSIFFEQAKYLPLEYSPTTPVSVQKLIFECTQIHPLKRPKQTEIKELYSSYQSILGPLKDSITGRLFDYKNFPQPGKSDQARQTVYKKLTGDKPLDRLLHEHTVSKIENSVDQSISVHYSLGPKSSMQSCLEVQRLRWNSLHKQNVKELVTAEIARINHQGKEYLKDPRGRKLAK